MIPTNLDHTLEKYLKLQLGLIESSRVDLWLKTMQKKSFHGEDIGRNDEEKLAMMILSDHEPEIAEFVPKYGNVSSAQQKIKLLIVILSMTMCLITYLFYGDGVQAQADLSSFENPVNKVFLQDGTIVLASGDSKLAYANDRRRVFFDGEGLFEVSKSYASPLLLCIKNEVVKISGVCFVQTSDSGFKLQVRDGTARVELNQTTQEVTVEKGRQLELKGDVILTGAIGSGVLRRWKYSQIEDTAGNAK